MSTAVHSADKYMSLTEAGASLPVPMGYATMYKWATAGVTYKGHRVILRTRSVGSGLYTSPEWLNEFQAQIVAIRGRVG